MIAQPYLLKDIDYHYKKNFKVLAQIDYSAEGLLVKKGGPFDIPLKEIVKKVKEKPETITIGIGGTWTAEDFVRAIFEEEAKVKFRRVSFPGANESIPALLGGHVDLLVVPASQWAHLYHAGDLNVPAVSTDKRDPRFPQIPTFRESGFDVVLSSYHWVGAPVGMPNPIVNFLADAFKKGFSEQAFKDASDKFGATAAWASPEDSLKTMDQIDEIYKRIVKKYDLKPQ
jgi:tripartite-type tricarboxylate transporter receptor subunit TctC